MLRDLQILNVCISMRCFWRGETRGAETKMQTIDRLLVSHTTSRFIKSLKSFHFVHVYFSFDRIQTTVMFYRQLIFVRKCQEKYNLNFCFHTDSETKIILASWPQGLKAGATFYQHLRSA